MNFDQIVAISIIVSALGLFIWGRLRYDMVALVGLMSAVILGIVPAREAFYGFGHPAVITVIAVLIISKALNNSGIVAAISAGIKPVQKVATLQIIFLTVAVGALSAFMNNVGALALMMPVALQQAVQSGRSPSTLMMPLSFGSLLGGLATLIGTPPNIIIANFRAETVGESFKMFDFLPVGGGVALAGMLFISLIGWRFLPKRKAAHEADESLFKLQGYITEVHITEESHLEGQLVREFENMIKGGGTIVSLIRKDRKILAPSGFVPIHQGDILLIEADPANLKPFVDSGDVEIGSQEANTEEITLQDDNVEIIEAVIPPGARMEGSTARSIRLRSRYGINLLAVAHQGRTILERLGRIRFEAGDVLLLQGEPQALREALAGLGCLPLATRELNLDKRRTIWPLIIFAGAIGLSATGFLPIQISFMVAVLLIIITGFLSIRDVYDSIEWPVIILLGAMIPIGQALQTTGATDIIAAVILDYSGMLTPSLLLAALIVTTMLLSDVINNAVTAVVMAPIGASLAIGLGVNVDAFLMAVAIGSSCTFLTPIGHQSNTLVMAPGGYKFSDYWRMGLPLDIIIVAAAVPLIQWAWPL